MKIGVVTTSYPRAPGDHAGNFVAAQVDALRELGHDVDVLSAATLGSPLFGDTGAPDALERGGLATYLAAARFSLVQTRAVARALSRWDVVIAHWIAPSALAVAIGSLARTTRPRVVVVAHGGDVHTLRRLRLLGIALRALRSIDARIVFVSHELLDLARAAAPSLRAWLDDASIVQPMGIDVARFMAVRARRAAAPVPTTPVVLVVARLVPIKGVDVAIRALAHVRTRVRLVIAGDGPDREALAALARAHASIELVGSVGADVRDQWLGEAACVVIPSRVLPNARSEGTPMIALEALAAGVPVIASDVGGLRDLPGIVRVRPDDPRALAAAIDRLLTHVPGGAARPAIDASAFDHRATARRVLGLVHPADCEAGDSTGRRSA